MFPVPNKPPARTGHARQQSVMSQKSVANKSQKGNTVITRYAPPPGYVPPAGFGQPNPYPQAPAYGMQTPYGAQATYPPQSYGYPSYAGYQHPQIGYAPSTAGYTPSPATGYPMTSAYAAPGYLASTGYPPSQGYAYPAQQAYGPTPLQTPPITYDPAHHPGQAGYLQPQHPSYPPQHIKPEDQASHQPSFQHVPRHSSATSISHHHSQPSIKLEEPSPQQRTRKQSATRQRADSTMSGQDSDASADWDDPAHINFGFGMFFLAEAHYSKDPAGIKAELSIGMIEYYPAQPNIVPLPSTFAEAEKQPYELRDSHEEHKHHPIRSMLIAAGRLEELESNIRQTEEWQHVKDDLIFVEFTRTCATISLADLRAGKNRPAKSSVEATKSEAPAMEAAEYAKVGQDPASDAMEVDNGSVDDDDIDSANGDQAMDLNSDSEDEPPDVPEAKLEPVAASGSPNQPETETTIISAEASGDALRKPGVLDSLEKALGFGDATTKNERPVSAKPFDTNVGGKVPTPELREGGQAKDGRVARLGSSSAPARDPRQEDMLAQLGVEGSPRAVFPTPSPAYGPGYPGNAAGWGNSFTQHGHQPVYDRTHAPPPPPESSRPAFESPWDYHNVGRKRNAGGDSPRSTSSQHTAPGGQDFNNVKPEEADNDATPKARPSKDRTGSGRKRTYDEHQESKSDGRRRQYDDVTPKLRRTRPPVDKAYRYR